MNGAVNELTDIIVGERQRRGVPLRLPGVLLDEMLGGRRVGGERTRVRFHHDGRERRCSGCIGHGWCEVISYGACGFVSLQWSDAGVYVCLHQPSSVFFCTCAVARACRDVEHGVHIRDGSEGPLVDLGRLTSRLKPWRSILRKHRIVMTVFSCYTQHDLQCIVDRFPVSTQLSGLTVNLGKTQVLSQPSPTASTPALSQPSEGRRYKDWVKQDLQWCKIRPQQLEQPAQDRTHWCPLTSAAAGGVRRNNLQQPGTHDTTAVMAAMTRAALPCHHCHSRHDTSRLFMPPHTHVCVHGPYKFLFPPVMDGKQEQCGAGGGREWRPAQARRTVCGRDMTVSL